MDAGRVIRPLQAKLDEVKADGLDVMLCSTEIIENVISLLKEQEDLGTELTNAMELIHKKNERIKKLEEQIETLTRWRANAGAFD